MEFRQWLWRFMVVAGEEEKREQSAGVDGFPADQNRQRGRRSGGGGSARRLGQRKWREGRVMRRRFWSEERENKGSVLGCCSSGGLVRLVVLDCSPVAARGSWCCDGGRKVMLLPSQAMERKGEEVAAQGFGGDSGDWQWCYFAGVVGVGVRWMFSGGGKEKRRGEREDGVWCGTTRAAGLTEEEAEAEVMVRRRGEGEEGERQRVAPLLVFRRHGGLTGEERGRGIRRCFAGVAASGEEREVRR
ncbi:hypothetical protein HAX54_034730 [Datura stramonium]|uniref:Uncharacterized protein n=1 Tax=Datura stramonium TaxID=4076 RepID=A0ABS8VFX7_DATST|nr:hypothetical protein [Datura stramonium]